MYVLGDGRWNMSLQKDSPDFRTNVLVNLEDKHAFVKGGQGAFLETKRVFVESMLVNSFVSIL
jgi:hypothetical protein